MIEWWVYLAVLGGLMVLGWLVNVIVMQATPADSRGNDYGIATLFLGDDGRTSTSKLQAVLWTFAILWALISLLTGAGVESFDKALSGNNLREEYLLLLGGPFAAAIAAKGITTKQTAENPAAKSKKEKVGKSTLAERVAEVVSNDEGGVDLGDFQYFAFTLVTLAYFTWAFIESPASGLPAIPGTLLVLVGVSQATYVGKKGLLQGNPAKNPDEAPELRRPTTRSSKLDDDVE